MERLSSGWGGLHLMRSIIKIVRSSVESRILAWGITSVTQERWVTRKIGS